MPTIVGNAQRPLEGNREAFAELNAIVFNADWRHNAADKEECGISMAV